MKEETTCELRPEFTEPESADKQARENFIPPNREVWAADEVPFEVAANRVIEHMKSECARLGLKFCEHVELKVEVLRDELSRKYVPKAQWRVWLTGRVGNWSNSLREACENIPSAESLRAEKIERARQKKAQAESELAALEGVQS